MPFSIMTVSMMTKHNTFCILHFAQYIQGYVTWHNTISITTQHNATHDNAVQYYNVTYHFGIQQNDTQHNATQLYDFQQKDTCNSITTTTIISLSNVTFFIVSQLTQLSVIMLSGIVVNVVAPSERTNYSKTVKIRKK